MLKDDVCFGCVNTTQEIKVKPNSSPLSLDSSFRKVKMTAEDEVKLIGSWASPDVLRARIALNLKGIMYKFIHEEFGKKSYLFLKSNPAFKKMSVLIHGRKSIYESLIIVQYIDEVWRAFGPSILPNNFYERAVARFWAAYIDDKVGPPTRVFIGDADEQSKSEAKEQLFAALLQLEEAFVKCSKGKSFFGGNTIGFVDIALGSYMSWLKAMEKIAGIQFLDEEKTPRLVKWADCFCSSSAFNEVAPEAEELVEFNKVILSTRHAAASPSK